MVVSSREPYKEFSVLVTHRFSCNLSPVDPVNYETRSYASWWWSSSSWVRWEGEEEVESRKIMTATVVLAPAIVYSISFCSLLAFLWTKKGSGRAGAEEEERGERKKISPSVTYCCCGFVGTLGFGASNKESLVLYGTIVTVWLYGFVSQRRGKLKFELRSHYFSLVKEQEWGELKWWWGWWWWWCEFKTLFMGLDFIVCLY